MSHIPLILQSVGLTQASSSSWKFCTSSQRVDWLWHDDEKKGRGCDGVLGVRAHGHEHLRAHPWKAAIPP
eukprot:746424-Hanusia_phi.AAC.6